MMKNSAQEKICNYLKNSKSLRFSLNLDSLSSSKKRHLKKLICPGIRGLKFLFLPIDHGLEHGPSDFLENPPSIDPEYELSLSMQCKLSGVVMHLGLAEKYWQRKQFKKRVNLVLKLNGKTFFGDDSEAFSPLLCSVEDGVKLGAEAVGYTFYVGSPKEADDFRQFKKVRREAEEFGIPLIVWSYPRGRIVESKIGKDSWATVSYAARVANEIGADLVKLNLPVNENENEKELNTSPFKNYLPYEKISFLDKLFWVREAAGAVGALVSGGKYKNEIELLENIRLSNRAGFDGIMFGRNLWQRPYDEAVSLIEKIKRVISD